MNRWIKAMAAGAIVIALAACATPQAESLRTNLGDVPPRADIKSAPFFPQKTKECGPASLAMALVASGVKTTPDALVSEVYTPKREGTLAPDMVTATRRHGRLAYLVPNMRAMFREVAGGRPVVVMQNLGLSWVPQWHFAEVIGYDIDNDNVILHSGTIARMNMDMDTFERTWARAHHWALLVLKPGELPKSPDRGRYVTAAAGLEQAGKLKAARAAYKAGLRLWPKDFALRMGLGNVLYGLNQKPASAKAFARAAKEHPGAGDAFNNLAQVRLDLGDLTGAEAAARKAVRIGGANMPTYRETLAAILARKSADARQ